MENVKEKFSKGYSLCSNEWAIDKNIKNDLGLLLIISSLSARDGFCYASNNYFSKLLDYDEVSISRKIKNLEKNGYIKIEYIKKGAEVTKRILRLTKMLTDDYQKCYSTINKNVKENNISINNTSNKKAINEEEIKKLINYYELQDIDKWLFLVSDWLSYKKSRKEEYKRLQDLKRFMSELLRLSDGNYETANKIINKSIISSWRGIFQLNEQEKPKKYNPML